MKQNYNPDVLSCLANLSNDEVFTPPTLANEILDILPAELWSNPEARFLDPVCKSGVFLREIAKRLMNGLKEIIPDEQERANHIFKNQLFGIAITEITSFVSRRSLYCSKTANGEFSVCTAFDNEQGNIYYERMQHTWKNGKCVYCGSSQEVYDRDEVLETHAYNFIHTDVIAGEDPQSCEQSCHCGLDPQSPNNKTKITNMKFDVIIGNPPYQLNDGGGSNGISAKPIYHLFIEQAKKLNPRYLSMIIPARWYAGGKGLDNFRQEMLNDKKIRILVDFPKSRECFYGVDIAGGVCYFLWDRDKQGDCEITSNISKSTSKTIRPLNEFDVFIRDNIGVEIIHKVESKKQPNFSNIVLPRNSFGFTTSARGKELPFKNSITLISSFGNSYINLDEVTKNREKVDCFKISVGTLNPDRGGVNNASDGKMNVTTKVKILKPNEVVTETYIIVNTLKTESEAINCAEYFRTKFVRLLISLTLSSIHIVRENFQFVPVQDFNERWSDEKLYKKYGLTQEEISFIESMLRPMDLNTIEEKEEWL